MKTYICPQCGKNMSKGAARCMKCAKSDPEYRQKVSKALTGRKISPKFREHLIKIGGMKKSKRTQDHIQKVTQANYDNGKYMPIGTIRKIGSRGYFYIKAYTDRGKRNWVTYHRYVIEQNIGRKLRNNEIVHHIDGDKSNNDISNLILMTSAQHNILNHFLGLLSTSSPEVRQGVIRTIKNRISEFN